MGEYCHFKDDHSTYRRVITHNVVIMLPSKNIIKDITCCSEHDRNNNYYYIYRVCHITAPTLLSKLLWPIYKTFILLLPSKDVRKSHVLVQTSLLYQLCTTSIHLVSCILIRSNAQRSTFTFPHVSSSQRYFSVDSV